MAFLSHLRPNNKSKKPITKRKTAMGTSVTKVTPRVAMITASVATAANAPTVALRQFTVIPATRTRVNASTNSTAEARNAAMTIAHGMCCFLLFSLKFGLACLGEMVRQFAGSHEPAHKCQAMIFRRVAREL